MRIFLFLLAISFGVSLYGQKNSDLKYFNVKDEIAKGNIVIIGQGFEDSGYNRLPYSIKDSIRKAVWDLGQNSAGIALKFSTNSKCIGAKWTLLNNFNMPHMTGTGIRGLDLYTLYDDKWTYAGSAQPNGKESANIFRRNMNGEERDYIMYLPLYDGVTDILIGVDSTSVISSPKYALDDRKPIVFYGTSVTQGGCASRPGMAYPAIIGRELNIETINLGFSGNGRMDRILARRISKIDASAYVIDCLANCTAQIVKDSTEYFISQIAKNNPKTPVYMVNNYCYPYQYLDEKFRTELKEENQIWYSIYLKLKADGMNNIHFIDMGSNGYIENSPAGPDHEGSVDGVHLTDLGFLRLAKKYLEYLTE